ncbi:MAG: hypothetical protein ACYCZL_00245 [Polaromonas sp.]
MTIRAEPDWRAPKLTPVPFDVVGDELVVVQWHIKNVIYPAGIDGYLRNLWGSLIEKPRLFLGSVATRAAITAELGKRMEMETTVGKSANAWRSCFYHGLMTDTVALDYLAGVVNSALA